MKILLPIAVLAAFGAAHLSGQTSELTLAGQEDAPRVRVSGVVVDAPTGSPIRGAHISIGGFGMAGSEGESDFQGRFDIPDVSSADRARFAVSKSGYESYGNAVPIPATGDLTNLRVPLNRTAVITGRVTGPDGEPMEGVQVGILHRVYQEGQPVYISQGPSGSFSGGTRSDDRGEYRAWGLPAGEYVVFAEPAAEPGPSGTTIYPATAIFYPNATSMEGAARVRVEWGQILEGINLDLRPPSATRIDTAVAGQDMDNCENCMAELFRRAGDGWMRVDQRLRVARDGTLSIGGLAPAQYALRVMAFNQRSGSVVSGASEVTVVEGRAVPVAIETYGEQPVLGRIELVDPPASVTGPEAVSWRSQLFLRPRFGQPFAGVPTRGMRAEVSGSKLEFSMTAGTGDHGLWLNSPPADGYVRGVTAAGRPIEGPHISVLPGGFEDMVVSVAFDGGTLAGQVDDGEDASPRDPLRPSTVIRLVPQDGGATFVRNLSAPVFTDRSFQRGSIPPGRYRVFAVEGRGYDLEDPEVAKKLAPWSKVVEIHSGQTTRVNLGIAPPIEEIQ